MICSMILAPHSKKAPSPFEFFNMPLLSKLNSPKKDSKQDLNIAEMFNTGLLNPLKDKNISLYNRLNDSGLIDKELVNKYIKEKWRER